MLDKCDAEINAVGQCFPNTKVLLCDFHRLQAWWRWLKNRMTTGWAPRPNKYIAWLNHYLPATTARAPCSYSCKLVARKRPCTF